MPVDRDSRRAAPKEKLTAREDARPTIKNRLNIFSSVCIGVYLWLILFSRRAVAMDRPMAAVKMTMITSSEAVVEISY